MEKKWNLRLTIVGLRGREPRGQPEQESGRARWAPILPAIRSRFGLVGRRTMDV